MDEKCNTQFKLTRRYKVGTLRAYVVQVENLWQTLRRFYRSRNRVYNHFSDLNRVFNAVDQLNCADIFHSVSPAQEMVCDDAVRRIANVSLVLCILGIIALVLFAVNFCIWRVSLFNRWVEIDTIQSQTKQQKLLDIPTAVSKNSSRSMLLQKQPGCG